jgi:hypothetical protein
MARKEFGCEKKTLCVLRDSETDDDDDDAFYGKEFAIFMAFLSDSFLMENELKLITNKS